MSQQKPHRFTIKNWGPLLSVLFLAPLALAPKGCSSGMVGDDCPADKTCGSAGKSSNPDGGEPPTYGTSPDGGKTPSDAGTTPDSGTLKDGGTTPDSGTSLDGGTPSDAGPKLDGGTPSDGDASPDGGTPSDGDASPDGGTPSDGGSQIACGGALGETCSAGDYCAYPNSSCGVANQTGVCRQRPKACDTVEAPVCGCDSRTYVNECVAAASGVSLQAQGVCNDAGVPADAATP